MKKGACKIKRLCAALLCVGVLTTQNGLTVLAQTRDTEQSTETEQVLGTEQAINMEQSRGTEQVLGIEQPLGTEQSRGTEQQTGTEQSSEIEQSSGTEQSTGTEQPSEIEQSRGTEQQTGTEQPTETETETETETTISLSVVTIQSIVAAKNSLKLTWTAAADATGYQIYRADTQTGEYSLLATTGRGNCTYTDASVKAGQYYFYRIRVIGLQNGKEVYGSDSVAVSGICMKQAKLSTVLSASSTSLRLTWEQVVGATGYKLYRSEKKTGNYKLVKTVTKGSITSCTDKKRKTGKRYYYKICAVNSEGQTEALSPAKSAKTLEKTALVRIKAKNSTSLELTWKKQKGATGYEIYRSTSANGTFTCIKTISNASKVKYTDKTVRTGKRYYYRVKTIAVTKNQTAYGSSSKAMSAKTIAAPAVKKAKAVAGTGIRLSWKKVSGAKGYLIYRCSKKNGSYRKVATISSAATTTYTDQVKKTDYTYYYKIKAINKNGSTTGYSDSSKILSGRAVAAPVIDNITLSHSGGLKIHWNRVSGAVGYTVYSSVNGGSYTKMAQVTRGKTVSYVDDTVRSGNTYSYKVEAHNQFNQVIGNSGKSAEKSYTIFYYNIMGSNTVSAAQMAACFNASGHAYPADVYAPRGAATVNDFAQIVLEEAAAEGVSGEVVWAQIILETGWLSFAGSMVRSDQCNFGGLGATDNSGGVFTATYPDVRTGVRAQVQHLKAYASTAKLNNALVDTRFALVTRGTAVYVEWLGKQENPQGYGWATGADYGFKIHRLINQIKSY